MGELHTAAGGAVLHLSSSAIKQQHDQAGPVPVPSSSPLPSLLQLTSDQPALIAVQLVLFHAQRAVLHSGSTFHQGLTTQHRDIQCRGLQVLRGSPAYGQTQSSSLSYAGR